MKRGHYGLDAPAVVIGYITSGVLLTFTGYVILSGANWLGNLGVICLIIGIYMTYSSKVGKYRLRERMINHLSLTGGEVILDVGCGRGLMLHGAASLLTTGKAYGVDIWSAKDQSGNTYDAVMKNARIEGTQEKVEVVNADMRNLPFSDESFDVITSSLAIHNLKNNREREKALMEIARVAKKGCRLAILDIAHVNYYQLILEREGFLIETVQHPLQIFPPCKVLYAIKK